MSKCGVCRAAKDAEYYKRIKRDKARMDARRVRDRNRYASMKQDPVRLAHYQQTKRAWWKERIECESSTLDATLLSWVHKHA